jgi:serine/threonine protein kinase
VTESETFTDVCPQCGTEYADSVRYCAQCGGTLHDLEPERSTQLAAGTIVGSYRLLDLLGEGGMGRVYLAEHIKLGRRVALKMLRAELGANPIAVARFFAEARAVNRISHENIVEITDFLDQSAGHNCYIMELLRGEDLGLRLLRCELLPIAVAVEVGAQIASALTAVHAVGIVHRDLKPDNIFLIERASTTNFVKLLDFGVAKLSGLGDRGMSLHTTAIGQIVGTPEYMSPEQAGGEAVDHRTDIYALGVILYEAVTGRLPFQAKNFGELMLQHLIAPPPRASSYADLPHQIPPALDDLIVELLAKNPADRPSSMAEVQERLQAIHDGLGLPPTPRRIASSGAIRTIRPGSSGPIARPGSSPSAGQSGASIARQGSGPIARASGPITPQGSGPIARHASDPIARAGSGPIARRASGPIVRHASGPISRGGARPAARTPGSAASLRAAVSTSAAASWWTPVPRLEWWLGAGLAVVLAALVVVWSWRTGAAEAAGTSEVQPSAPIAQVQLRFQSTPAGAVVRDPRSGAELGTTPFIARRTREARTMTVEVTKDGYQPAIQDIDLGHDGTLLVALVAVPAAPAPAAPATPAPAATAAPAPATSAPAATAATASAPTASAQ